MKKMKSALCFALLIAINLDQSPLAILRPTNAFKKTNKDIRNPTSIQNNILNKEKYGYHDQKIFIAINTEVGPQIFIKRNAKIDPEMLISVYPNTDNENSPMHNNNVIKSINNSGNPVEK